MTANSDIRARNLDRLEKLRELKRLIDQRDKLIDQRDNPRPAYHYVPPETGGDETILIEQSGQTVSAPPGAGLFFAKIENDDAFDAPSTTMEETAAMFEKQAAYIALVLNAYGLVPDDEVNDYIADRSLALASAQKREPEYMKEFQRQFDDAKGFFETAGVFLGNPRALGRLAVTNAPNSVIPLLTTLAGAASGAATVNPLGAVAGGSLGAFSGGALVEIGSEIDAMMTDAGVDATDAQQVLAALQNDDFMNTIKIKAERKGFTTAAVDALFQIFGGRIVKAVKGPGKLRKIAAGAADVGVQSLGEGVGEAAGQFARDGKVDYKEAALEAVAAISQSAGQSAIGATVGLGKRAVGRPQAKAPETSVTATKTNVATETESAAKKAAPPKNADTETKTADIQADIRDALETAGVEDLDAPESAKMTEDIAALGEEAPAFLREIEARGVEGIDALREELTDKRVAMLEAESSRLKARIDARIDDLKNRIPDPKESGEIKQLKKNLREIDNELDKIIVDEEENVVGKPIETKAAILRRERVALRRVVSAFKDGVRLARKDVKSAQTAVVNAIEKAGLAPKNRAKFLRSVKNIQTKEQALKILPRLQSRVETMLDKQERADITAKIKKAVRRAKKTKTIAVDFVRAIESLVDDIELKGHTEKTMQSLKASQEFFAKNPDRAVPKNIARRLAVLDKTPIDDIDTNDLRALLADIEQLTAQGKTKLALKEKAKQRLKQRRLKELRNTVKPINKRPLKGRTPGERLAIMDQVRNKFAEAANKARERSLAINPMDVFFDMLDGGANYAGAAHRIFKQTIDKAFSRYLDRKEQATRPVKELADKLKLDDLNFERVGVYAAAQQEGGMEKLEAMGLTAAQVEAIKLTDGEMRFYNLMRRTLDDMFPEINRVMTDIYNKDVTQVADYFPFVTDFEAMNDFEIQDMLGEDVPTLNIKRKDVEKGFTKTRVGGKNAIKLDAMSVFLRHVDNAAYLVEMGRDIKELGELTQTKDWEAIAGDMGQDFTKDWIDLLARKGRSRNPVAFFDTLRRNVGAAVLAFKLSSALVQPTALLHGAALIGGHYVRRGMWKFLGDKQWRAFLRDNFPEVRERVGDDPAYLDMGGKSWLSKARDIGITPLKNLDLFAAASVAVGAYMRSVETRGGVVDLNKVDADAVQEAQLLMRRTQSSSFAKDSPQIISVGKLTGNASLDKMIFQFQSFMLNEWSLIKHDAGAAGIGRGRVAQAANIVFYVMLAEMATMGLRQLSREIAAYATDADIDPWEDTINEDVVRTLLGSVPFVSQGVALLAYGSNPVPALDVANKIISHAHAVAVSKNADTKAKHAAETLLLSLGMWPGVPGVFQFDQLVRQATRDKKKGGW